MKKCFKFVNHTNVIFLCVYNSSLEDKVIESVRHHIKKKKIPTMGWGNCGGCYQADKVGAWWDCLSASPGTWEMFSLLHPLPHSQALVPPSATSLFLSSPPLPVSPFSLPLFLSSFSLPTFLLSILILPLILLGSPHPFPLSPPLLFLHSLWLIHSLFKQTCIGIS